MREDDGTEARACPERTVMPVPVSFLYLRHSFPCAIPFPSSFLALRHSCPCVIPAKAGIHPQVLKKGGARDQRHCASEAKESQHSRQQDDAGNTPVVCAKALGQQ